MIHLYCGDGKGKTTAAVGLSVRCAGAGGRVCFFQFLKNNSSSERVILKNINGITLVDGAENVKFVKKMSEYEKNFFAEFYQKKFDAITKSVSECCKSENNCKYDMLVFDEIVNAVNVGFLKEEKLLRFLENKPQFLEVVLTGRNPTENIIKYSDYVSEIKKIKHPFDKGISARRMIEF